MEAPFSPIVRKIAGEVSASPKRSFTRPTEICLEEWWLSKPEGGKGFAVTGRDVRPHEIRKCENERKIQSAPAKRRFAVREFHSADIVRRHGCTTVETSDGLIVSLCGFMNRSRSQQNGFSSEVCREFLYGFPYNWDDYGSPVGEDSSPDNHKEFTECLSPAALDAFNGAQLHDSVLYLSDAGRDLFNKNVYDDLIKMLTLQTTDGIEAQPSNFTPCQVDAGDSKSKSPRTRSSKKRPSNAVSKTSSKMESSEKNSRVKKM